MRFFFCIFNFQSIGPRGDAFYKLICLYVCVCVCLSGWLFTFEVPLHSLFALTSQSWMSKISIYSESLVKSNGKKWSQIWKLLLIKGVKLPQQKKFFTDFFYLVNPFKRLFAPTSEGPMSKLFRFLESLGKSNRRKCFFWRVVPY